MKQFNERFVHEKVMVKEYLGTSVRQVKMKKSRRSISAALLVCKNVTSGVRYVAAQEGFNTKESRDSLLAEKGPQLEAACRGRGRHILRSLLRQIFAEKLSSPSPQDVAMPFAGSCSLHCSRCRQ